MPVFYAKKGLKSYVKMGPMPEKPFPDAEKLNLCYVADATNIHVRRWCGFFIRHGHNVTILSDKGGEVEGATVITLPNRDTMAGGGNGKKRKVSKTAVLLARTKAIKKTLRTLNPDILHAIFAYQRGWSAAYTGFHPLVITLLGSDIYLPRRHYRHKFQLWRDQWLNAMALRQADFVTAVTADLQHRADKMTHNHVMSELIPIGVDTRLFLPDADARDLRQRLAIPDGSFVVLSPRQITPLYNQETIIQAMPKVLQKLPNAVLILKDTVCDTEERKQYVAGLKKLAETLKVTEAIRWADHVPMEELPAFYSLANVVVSVPSTDGMPVTIFEAMSCQRPLIVGDLPSYDQVIIHGQTGLRVPVRNHVALAQAIVKISENPELTARLVDESQLTLQEYGIFDQQLWRMERYYQGLKFRQIRSRSGLGRMLDRLLFRFLVRTT